MPEGRHKHYCRECTQVFENGEEQRDIAHNLAMIHYIRDHNASRDFVRCSRYCEMVEQPEERTLGKKLYGVGSEESPRVGKRGYDSLFPEEDP